MPPKSLILCVLLMLAKHGAAQVADKIGKKDGQVPIPIYEKFQENGRQLRIAKDDSFSEYEPVVQVPIQSGDAFLELDDIEQPIRTFPLAVRVSNNGATTRTPGVRIYAFSDSECTQPVSLTYVSCSGSNGSNNTGTCRDALDISSNDVPEWAPQCSNCSKHEAWIKFEIPSEVKCIDAQGLGFEEGLWSGGIRVLYGQVAYVSEIHTDLWFYPVDCEGMWSNWTECTKSCGTGQQTRLFTVGTESAGLGSLACPQSPEEQVCNALPCLGSGADPTDSILDRKITLSSVTLDVLGNNSSVKLSRTNDPSNFIQLLPSMLHQKDITANNFSLSPVSWEPFVGVTSTGGAEVFKTSFAVSQLIGGNLATFTFTVELFREDSNETNGATIFAVDSSSAKWSVAVDNFPPIPAGDGLELSFTIKTRGGEEDGSMIAHKGSGPQKLMEVDHENGKHSLPTNAIINGVDTGDEGVTIALEKTGGKTHLTFFFPSPGDGQPFSLIYDPAIQVYACDDNLQNGNEEGVDCGGSCPDACGLPPAEVHDDPHFIGFDGSHYDFQGISGEVFNLISDTYYQLNARFIAPPTGDQTYMGELGFILYSNKILVSPKSVKINGHQIAHVGTHKLAPGGVVIRDGLRTIIVAEAFTVEVVTHHTKNFAYLNIDTEVQAQALYNPHGLLGQTAKYLALSEQPHPVKLKHSNKFAEGFIEGSPSDYLIMDQDLFGTDWTFNRYYKGISALQLRTRKLGAFLKRAALDGGVETEGRSANGVTKWRNARGTAVYLLGNEVSVSKS